MGCQQPQQQAAMQLYVCHTSAAAAAARDNMAGLCVHRICLSTRLLLLLPGLQESFTE
jgi:hypothetical protein